MYLNATLKGAPLDEQEQHTADAWIREPNFEVLLNMSMPGVIVTPCCASFIVDRERVHILAKHIYEVIFQWLVDTDMENYYSSRVMEYTWHILFGDPPVTGALDRSGLCDRKEE